MPERYLQASARPMAPAMFWVPASNLEGGSSRDMLPFSSKREFISPPHIRGVSSLSMSYLPYITPMPVGPHILWPEKQRKSAPVCFTSVLLWGTDWAPSST